MDREEAEMKKSILLCLMGLMFFSSELYAAGDLIVDGSLGVGTETTPKRRFVVKGTTTSAPTIGQETSSGLGWGHYIMSNGLRFREYTNTDWTAGSDWVTFESGGNVGIGVTAPNAKLQVKGSVSLGSGAAQSNKALCWTSSSKIGYCSTYIDSYGACTCNEIN